MESGTEQALRDLLDRAAIWQIMQRYGRGLDRMDLALARSCYFDDAIDDHDCFIGAPDSFLAWANASSEAFVCHHHGIMNHHCELEGNDAHAETYYLFIGVATEPPHLMSMGRYVDHLQRRDGEWRIANRVTIIEKNFSLQDSPLGASGAFGLAPVTATRGLDDVSYQRPVRPRAGCPG